MRPVHFSLKAHGFNNGSRYGTETGLHSRSLRIPALVVARTPAHLLNPMHTPDPVGSCRATTFLFSAAWRQFEPV